MLALNLIFIIFGLAFTLALFVGFFWVMSQAHKDRAVKREIALRFYPDEQGNYPQDHYLLERGIYLQSGNNRAQVAPTYLVQPVRSEVTSALPSRPEPVQKVYGKPLPAEVETTSRPQLPQSQAEVTALLIECKERGLTKTEALAKLGITGGRSFTKFAKIFDTLP